MIPFSVMQRFGGHPGTIVSLEQLNEKFCALEVPENKSKQLIAVSSLNKISLIIRC
jgi:hypothetical protein